MRCYFMKDGRISGVEFLTKNADAERVEEAREIFHRLGKAKGADGFEVWDGARFVYRFPEAEPRP